MPERRRIRSIPKRTMLDVLREGCTIQSGGGSRSGRGPLASWEAEEQSRKTAAQQSKNQQPLPRQGPSSLFLERDGNIRWTTEVMPNYDGRNALGIFIEFKGINFTGASFMRGRRDYGPDVTLFYSPVIYAQRRALLLLSTEGDILEYQVVPAQKDTDLVSQGELYLPELTAYNPTSMAVRQTNGTNGLVVISYK